MVHSEALIAALALIGTFGTFLTGMYMFFSTRHKERMALIEQGKEANIFYSNKRLFANGALKLGMLAFGVGVGILLGSILAYAGLQEEVAYFSSMLICGGAGLILYYRYTAQKIELIQEKENMYNPSPKDFDADLRSVD